MTCRGTCDRYKAKKPFGMSRYAAGQKRCQDCEIFMNTAGNRCPCCNMKLRVRPRSLKSKQILSQAEDNGQVEKFGIEMIPA